METVTDIRFEFEYAMKNKISLLFLDLLMAIYANIPNLGKGHQQQGNHIGKWWTHITNDMQVWHTRMFQFVDFDHIACAQVPNLKQIGKEDESKQSCKVARFQRVQGIRHLVCL